MSGKDFKWSGAARVVRESYLSVRVEYVSSKTRVLAYQYNKDRDERYSEQPANDAKWQYVAVSDRKRVVLCVPLNDAEDPLADVIDAWLKMGLDVKKLHKTCLPHARVSEFWEGVVANPYRLVGRHFRFEDLDPLFAGAGVPRAEGALLEIIWAAEQDGHTYIYPWWRNYL